MARPIYICVWSAGGKEVSAFFPGSVFLLTQCPLRQVPQLTVRSQGHDLGRVGRII